AKRGEHLRALRVALFVALQRKRSDGELDFDKRFLGHSKQINLGIGRRSMAAPFLFGGHRSGGRSLQGSVAGFGYFVWVDSRFGFLGGLDLRFGEETFPVFDGLFFSASSTGVDFVSEDSPRA